MGKHGLEIIDYEDHREIYSSWSEHKYIFTWEEVNNNISKEFSQGIKYEQIKANGELLSRSFYYIS